MSLLIKHKIWIGFSLILLVLMVTIGVSLLNLTNTKKIVNEVVVDSQPMLIQAQRFIAHISDAHSSFGEFLFNKSDKARQGFQNSLYEADEVLNEMSKLPIVLKTPSLKNSIDSFHQDLNRYQVYDKKIIALSADLQKNYPAQNFAAQNLNPIATEFLSLIKQMIESEIEEQKEELNIERVVWLSILQNTRYGFVKLMSNARIYIATPNEGSLINMKAEGENLLSIIAKMSDENFVDLYTFEQEVGVPLLLELAERYVGDFGQLEALNSTEKRRVDAYLYTHEMAPIIESLKQELEALVDKLLSNNKTKSESLIDQVSYAEIAQLFLALVGLVIGVVIALVISRMVTLPLIETVSALQNLAQGEGDLTKRLNVKSQDEIGQLSQAFNEFSQKVQALVSDVADSAMQLADSASQMDVAASSAQSEISNQNGQIDQVVQEIESMNVKIQDVVGHTNQAANLAEETNNNASKGQQVVNQSSTSSQQLAQDVDRASQVINELENDVVTIGGVLDVIRGIAEQTNLLALNAAIEAARAGEQGRGFAVVADEVRTLASRTGESTEEIQKMIERLQVGSKQAVQVMQQGKTKADEGLGLAAQAGESLDSISTAIQGMLEMNKEIANGTELQSQSAKQVTQNIISIKSISDQTAQSAESMASASSNVMQLARQLQSLLGQFKI